MRGSTDNLVGVLDELGFLHLEGGGRDGGLGPDDDVFVFDHRAEQRGHDLMDPLDELRIAQASRSDSAHEAARQRREEALIRIRERLGAGQPSLPPDPDVLAWYQPIHYYGPLWGIFVRESGIEEIAKAIAEFVNSKRPPLRVAAECQRMAHVMLRLHEQFHHKLESAAIRLEVIGQRELYFPYDQNVYLPLRATNSRELLEEAIANAWMFKKRLNDADGVDKDVREGSERFLRWWIPQLPGAYARGIEIAESGIERYLFRLTGQVNEGVIDPDRPDHQWTTVTHLHDPMHSRRSPHYIVVPKGQVPYLPHSNPSKGLALTAREMGKLLEELGWKRSETNRGRHPVKYVKSGCGPIPVPAQRGSLAKGTMEAIAKAAGFQNARAMVAGTP